MDLYEEFEAELALLRGTVCAIAGLAAATLAAPAARPRRHRLRSAAISIAAMSVILAGVGLGAATAAFHVRQPVITRIAHHSRRP